MGVLGKMISKILGKTVENNYKNDKKNREEDPWIPGAKEEDKGMIVTPEELAKVLCTFCYNCTTYTVNDEDFFEILDKNKENTSALLKTHYFCEMMAFYWFFGIDQVSRFFKDEQTKNRIINSMYEELYMIIKSTYKEDEKIIAEQFFKIYEEYVKISLEKDWYLLIIPHLLNNLMLQETKDPHKENDLLCYVAIGLGNIFDIIKKDYKIVLDKK